MSSISMFVGEHYDEASFIWLQRANANQAPNYDLTQFAELDERLAAHIDGLRVAGDEGWRQAEAALRNERPEDFFPAAVLAIEASNPRFDNLTERAEIAIEVIPGLISGLGWVPPEHLAGRVKSMLEDASPIKQMFGVAACAMHRKDFQKLAEFLSSTDPKVRSRALRTAGELGRRDLLGQVKNAIADPKIEARFWATWSGVLLGDRKITLDALGTYALKSGTHQMRALQVSLFSMAPSIGHELLQQLPRSPDAERLRIIGTGYIGMVDDVPWLLEQMKQPHFARIAGEAFVNITGADFNLDQLESLPPEDFEDGPTDDPDDENVEMPEDIALPWPNQERIKTWWDTNNGRFKSSERYFLGVPVTREHCIHVLKEGFQRQRVAAALHLSLRHPGTQLFPTSAPAWRQKRLLVEMV